MSFLTDTRNKYGCRSFDSPVLLRGGWQSLLAPLAALGRMLRDYEIMGQVSAAPPDSEAQSHGACAIVVFSNVTGRIIFTPIRSPER